MGPWWGVSNTSRCRANQLRACAGAHGRRDNLPLRALWLRLMLKVGLTVGFRAVEPGEAASA